MTTPPPPPTAAEIAAADVERARWSAPRGPSGAVLIMWLGLTTLLGAGFAYFQAAGSKRLDNMYMGGDQSVSANYSTALFLAAAGAVLLVLAAILHEPRQRR
jgi:hypothetical protein